MIKIHQFFLRTTIVITIITLALSAYVIVQQLNRNIRGKLDSFLYIPSIGLAVILAFLSIPKLRCNAVAAPHRLIHIAVQVIMGLCGAVLITWTGLVAFNSPLMGQFYMAPFLALACGAIYVALGIIGSLRAIWTPA
jgi:hypothetical protein